MIVRIALGAALGWGAGWWVAQSPRTQLDDPLWWLVQAAIGGFQAWGATWILRQSGDLKKMWTAILLTGPVLASLFCIFSGEPFHPAVLAATALGILMAAWASLDRRRTGA